MPETADRIFAQLSAENVLLKTSRNLVISIWKQGCGKPEILFARLDLKEVLEVEASNILEDDKAEGQAGEDIAKTEELNKSDIIDIEASKITYDDFQMQFQIGEIIACEEVKSLEAIMLSGKDWLS